MSNLTLERIQLGEDRVLMISEEGRVELRRGTAHYPGELITVLDDAVSDDPHDQWLYRPIGESFALRDDLDGVLPPPTDDPRFRYVRLTASDPYNDGVLAGEEIEGAAPLIVATAVVSLSESPMYGVTIDLINTERSFIRPGAPGVRENSQNLEHTHAIHNDGNHSHIVQRIRNAANAVFHERGGTGMDGAFAENVGTTANGIHSHGMNASGGSEARPRSIGATYYMRIK